MKKHILYLSIALLALAKTAESQCRGDQFSCNDGQCIQVQQRCDGRPDCRNGQDEYNCTGLPSSSCAENEFPCAAGFCIMGYKKCNGIKDCPSGNDEDNCQPTIPPEPSCASSEFRCKDGRCIDIRFRCDSVPDCSDNTDEINCYYNGGGYSSICFDNNNRLAVDRKAHTTLPRPFSFV
jgi:hypothetical protein